MTPDSGAVAPCPYDKRRRSTEHDEDEDDKENWQEEATKSYKRLVAEHSFLILFHIPTVIYTTINVPSSPTSWNRRGGAGECLKNFTIYWTFSISSESQAEGDVVTCKYILFLFKKKKQTKNEKNFSIENLD